MVLVPHIEADYSFVSPFTKVAQEEIFLMLGVQSAGTHRTAQSRVLVLVLVLDAVLTQQACVMPLLAAPRSTLNTHSAVLKKSKK